jgi:hypothetical protein
VQDFPHRQPPYVISDDNVWRKTTCVVFQCSQTWVFVEASRLFFR